MCEVKSTIYHTAMPFDEKCVQKWEDRILIRDIYTV